MIRGTVVGAREAMVQLPVRSDAGQELDIQFVVDTGFTDELVLPPAIVSSLGLRYHSSTYATMGDGSVVSIDVYTATILWDSRSRIVKVHEAGGGPLIGMGLLSGHRMCMDVLDGGAVTIDSLPRP